MEVHDFDGIQHIALRCYRNRSAATGLVPDMDSHSHPQGLPSTSGQKLVAARPQSYVTPPGYSYWYSFLRLWLGARSRLASGHEPTSRWSWAW